LLKICKVEAKYPIDKPKREVIYLLRFLKFPLQQRYLEDKTVGGFKIEFFTPLGVVDKKIRN